MVQPVAGWRTITGTRRTSSTDTVNLIVEGYHNILDGDIARVDFYISSNGAASIVSSVTTRADWIPDDTDTTDPLPGVISGPAVIPACYGKTLDMSAYDAGYIDVYAIVVPVIGTNRVLETIRIYNDKDGTDRRPSTKTIYVSPSGSNTNDGLSTSSPVKTIVAAITKAWQNGDCGGATIYLMEGTHIWGRNPGSGYDMSYAYTTGHHWLTITTAPGVQRNQAIVQRDSDPSNWLNFAATGKTGSGYYARIRLKNITIKGLNCPVTISGTTITYSAIWADGCVATDTVDYEKGTIPIGVSSRTGGSGTFVGFNVGTSVTTEIFCTGNIIHHYRGGFSNVKLSRGNYLYDLIGVAFQIGAPNEQHCNAVVENLSQNNVKGYFPAINNIDIVSTGTSGRFRVRAKTSTTSDFGDAGRYLLEIATKWGVKLSNFASNNNGNFTVVGAGYENGLSYIDITNANGSQVTNNSVGTIEPVELGTGNPFTTVIHSDLHQVNYGAQANNWMLTNIRGVNSYQAQGLSNNGNSNGSFAIVNVFDGRPNGLSPMNSYLYGNWTHGIIRNCTFAGNFLYDGSVTTATSSEIIDCIFENFSLNNVNLANIPFFVANNHFSNSVSSSVVNALGQNNGTQGNWKSEYDVGLKGNAKVIRSSLAYRSSSTTSWTGSSNFRRTNKGVFRNVASGDWRITTTNVDHGKCIAVNQTSYTRDDVVTMGVPFPKGKLYSTGQELVAWFDGQGQRRAQWEALPARWSDGSIKYAKVTYPITLTSQESIETQIRINSEDATTVEYTYNPLQTSTLNNLTVQLIFNNQTTTLDLNNAVRIEGGGPCDYYARYKLFGRVPAYPHIWYEFVYDILSGLNHSKFWFRYGNSYPERGYGLNTGSHANSAATVFSTPVQLRISGAVPSIRLERRGPSDSSGPYEVQSVSSITNGKVYTISTVNGRDEYFGLGIVKCLKGTLLFETSSDTSLAERVWPVLSMYRNWEGLQPIVGATNPLPSYLSTSTQIINSILNAEIPAKNSVLSSGSPYQKSFFGAKENGETGQYGWNGISNWANLIYSIFSSGYPYELPYLEYAASAALGYRTYAMYEGNGTPMSLRNYPECGIYGGHMDYRTNVTLDNAGYGLSNPGNSTLPFSWQGNNHQHFEYQSELAVSLVSCDYHLLRIAETMPGWVAIMANPNHFNQTIRAHTTPTREVARPLLTSLMLYEVSNNREALQFIKDRVSSIYSVIYENTPASSEWSAAGSPNRGLDYVMFYSIGFEEGESALPNGRESIMYPWQLPYLVTACYRAYKMLKELYGPNDSTALKARKIAYDLAASNVLYHQHKVGPGTTNSWQYIGTDSSTYNPSIGSVNNLNYNLVPPGTTVVGLSSGATGTVIRTISEIWDGHYVDYLIGSCTGTFLQGEQLRLTYNSVQRTCTASLIFTGYIGCKAYYVDYTASQSTRQTPLTLAQLEEVDYSPDRSLADKVYPGKNYRTYWPYQLWQQECAAIAKQGIRDSYYTNGTNKTIADLSEKVEDIISTAIADSEASPSTYNGQNLFDVSTWPFLMTIDDVATNENTSISRTIYPSPISVHGQIKDVTPTAVSVINSTISFTGNNGIVTISGSLESFSVGAINTVNVSITPSVANSNLQLNTIIVRPIVVTNITVNQDSTFTIIGSAQTIDEISIVNIPPAIINIILEMKIDTPSNETYIENIRNGVFDSLYSLDSTLPSLSDV